MTDLLPVGRVPPPTVAPPTVAPLSGAPLTVAPPSTAPLSVAPLSVAPPSVGPAGTSRPPVDVPRRGSGRTRDGGVARVLRAMLGVLLVAVVLVQIAYPLTSGRLRDAVTALVVVLLGVACLVHAGLGRGWRFAAAMLVTTAGLGFAAELVGVHTGMPFGSYVYTGALGPRFAGVPLVVALAWTMLAWPAAVVARSLARSYAVRVAIGTWATAACDLFLDPQQVRAGYWHWTSGGPHLPGVAAVPLSNLAGWLLVSLLVSAVLQRLTARAVPSDVAMLGLYLWLFVGWTLALAAFLGLPAAAGWGALGMGAVAVPLALRLASVRMGSARMGSARLGSARWGSVRWGSVRWGSVRWGSVRWGSVRH